MKVAVLGTGMVGRTLAPAIAEAGNDVTMGTRDVAQLLERNSDFAHWHGEHPAVGLDAFQAAAHCRAGLQCHVRVRATWVTSRPRGAWRCTCLCGCV